MTERDYFVLADKCGYGFLSDVRTGNYRQTQGDKDCKNPWDNDVNGSSFAPNSFTTSISRELQVEGASTLVLASVLRFRTGFNVFSASTDTERDAFGFSEDISATLIEGLGVSTLLSGAAGMLLVVSLI